MMAGGEIASAYLQIYPRLDGSSVSQAVQRAMAGVGDAAGDDFADGFRRSSTSGAGGAGTSAGNSFAENFRSAAAVALGNLMSQIASEAASQFSYYFGEGIAQSDALLKFAGTMSFAGFDDAEIQSSMESIRAYADQTVYDLGEVLDTSAKLAANGVEGYDSLVQAMGNLNAAAGGNSESFGYFANAITQVNGAGVLMTQDWNQMVNALPGASGAIQNELLAMGAWDDSMGTFRDALAAGEITADEFNAAIVSLGMTDVAQEAATSSATFEGATGQLEAAVTNTMMEIYDSLNENGRITEFIDNMASAFEAAAPIVSTLADAFGDFIEFIAPAIPIIAGIVTGIAAASVITTIVGAISGAVAFLTTVVGPALAMVGSVPGLIALVTSVLGGPITIIAAVIGAIIAFVATNEDARKKIVEIFNKIKSVISGALSAVKNAISTAANFIRSIWSAAMNALITAVSNAMSGIRNALGNIRNVVSNALSGAASWLVNAGQQIIQGLVNGIRNATSWVTNAVSNLCSDAIGTLKSFFGIASPSKLMAQMGGYMMAGLADGIADGASDAVNAMEGASESVAGALGFGGHSQFALAGAGVGGVTNNYYIDGDSFIADSRLAAALGVVAEYADMRGRMGTSGRR